MTTFFPLCPESANSPWDSPVIEGSLKSSAVSPTFNGIQHLRLIGLDERYLWDSPAGQISTGGGPRHGTILSPEHGSYDPGTLSSARQLIRKHSSSRTLLALDGRTMLGRARPLSTWARSGPPDQTNPGFRP